MLKLHFDVALPMSPYEQAVAPAIAVPTSGQFERSESNPEFDYSKIKAPESRWFRGDLHAHTVLSDGHNTLEAATEIIERQQLDFMFLTEHNICHPALPDSDRTLILAGYRGHDRQRPFQCPRASGWSCDAQCRLQQRGIDPSGFGDCWQYQY